MYNISEASNLKALDKALKTQTQSFGVFSHKLLSAQDIKQMRMGQVAVEPSKSGPNFNATFTTDKKKK